MSILTATEWLIIVAALIAIKLACDTFRLWRGWRDRGGNVKRWR
jgi:hypothetical protein